MDIVLAAEGEDLAVREAHEQAWRRFQPLLDELAGELPMLRQPVLAGGCPLRGEVARLMWRACAAHRPLFVTPMAAVAGAVAQTLLAAYRRPGIRRAWVNNGGDIALQLAAGESLRIGLAADPSRLDASALAHAAQGRLDLQGQLRLHADDGVAGLATSGWGGRSHSLGIADSVTVLAADAASADAAATLLANAVDAPHPAIHRRPACELRDDSDLGERLVTVAVPRLPAALVEQALDAGLAQAQRLCAEGLVVAALLACQGRVRAAGVGALSPAIPDRSATPALTP